MPKQAKKPRRKYRYQYLHKFTDLCMAMGQRGYCGAPIFRHLWTFWKVWNESRDGVRRPTRCCECIAKEIAEGGRAA